MSPVYGCNQIETLCLSQKFRRRMDTLQFRKGFGLHMVNSSSLFAEGEVTIFQPLRSTHIADFRQEEHPGMVCELLVPMAYQIDHLRS